MKNIKSTPILLLLVMVLLFFASCTSKSEARKIEKDSKDIRVLKAQFVNSQITTNIEVKSNDVFTEGDTVWAVQTEDNGRLSVIYNFPVDSQDSYTSLKLYRVVVLGPVNKELLEIYTPQDILFADLNSLKLFSESGKLDTTFGTKSELVDFIAITTARHTDK